MIEPDAKFLKLFDAEIQNRAFALYATEIMIKRVKKTDDVLWYSTWLQWEKFHKRNFAPMAKKYGLSQEPAFASKLQARIGDFAARLLSETAVMKYVLKETEKYCSQLQELADIAPEEDKEFFEYVVEQERLQVEVLPFRIDGNSKKGADMLLDYMDTYDAQQAITPA